SRFGTGNCISSMARSSARQSFSKLGFAHRIGSNCSSMIWRRSMVSERVISTFRASGGNSAFLLGLCSRFKELIAMSIASTQSFLSCSLMRSSRRTPRFWILSSAIASFIVIAFTHHFSSAGHTVRELFTIWRRTIGWHERISPSALPTLPRASFLVVSPPPHRSKIFWVDGRREINVLTSDVKNLLIVLIYAYSPVQSVRVNQPLLHLTVPPSHKSFHKTYLCTHRYIAAAQHQSLHTLSFFHIRHRGVHYRLQCKKLEYHSLSNTLFIACMRNGYKLFRR